MLGLRHLTAETSTVFCPHALKIEKERSASKCTAMEKYGIPLPAPSRRRISAVLHSQVVVDCWDPRRILQSLCLLPSQRLQNIYRRDFLLVFVLVFVLIGDSLNI